MYEKCEENIRLADALEHALDLACAATSAVEVARPATPMHEYKRLQRYLQQVVGEVKLAREKWEAHRKEHGCS